MPRSLLAAFCAALILPLIVVEVARAATPTVEDVAAVAEAHGLTCDDPDDQGDGFVHLTCLREVDSDETNIDLSLTYNLTGPEAVSLADTAARLSDFIGRRVGYHEETEEEAYASRASFEAPDWEVRGWVTSYQAIAAGELETVSDTVESLTGRPAETMEDFLAAHPESYRHLLD